MRLTFLISITIFLTFSIQASTSFTPKEVLKKNGAFERVLNRTISSCNGCYANGSCYQVGAQLWDYNMCDICTCLSDGSWDCTNSPDCD